MGLVDQEADRAGIDAILFQIARRGDVAESLRHLGAAHVQELGVHPDPREFRLAGKGAALGDLVLVVRKDEVDAAGMDVQDLRPEARPISSSAMAEHSRCQPGRPRPKGASQAAETASSSGLAAFHRTKSRAFSLSYSSLETRPLAPLLSSRLSSWESRPYEGKPADREVDRSVVTLVGGSVGEQAAHQAHHRLHEFGGAGVAVRRPESEEIPILVKRRDEGRDQSLNRDARVPASLMIRSSTSVRFMM